MGFRRFQNFQIGALSAQRLNEMQAAIERLQSRVDGRAGMEEAVRERIVARVTAQGVKAGFDSCTGAIRCVSYQFTEVFLKVSKIGDVTDATCVGYEIPDGAISSGTGGYLLVLEDEPSLNVGDVVVAHLASMTVADNAQDKQQVYVADAPAATGAGGVRICTLTDVLADGKYRGKLNGDGQDVEIENLYETQDYYGAANVTLECASIVSGMRLPVGSDVWASKVSGTGDRAGSWVTMTPVPFGVECTCGDLGQPLSAMTATADKDAVSVGIISRIMGGVV